MVVVNLKCVFYELDITPSLGSIIPGSFEARYLDEISEPLYVRAICEIRKEYESCL